MDTAGDLQERPAARLPVFIPPDIEHVAAETPSPPSGSWYTFFPNAANALVSRASDIGYMTGVKLAALATDNSLIGLRTMAPVNPLHIPNIRPKRYVKNFHKAPPSAIMPELMATEKVAFRFSEDNRYAFRYYAALPPEDQQPWSDTYWFLQSKNAFIELYIDKMRAVHQQGHLVFCEDLISQGLSPRLTENPQKVHVPDFEIYKQQALEFYEHIIKPQQKGRLVMAASSTGALIALHLVMNGLIEPQRLVLISPLIKPVLPRNIEPDSGTMRDLLRLGASLQNEDDYFLQSRTGYGDDTLVSRITNPATRDATLATNLFSHDHTRLIKLAAQMTTEPRLVTSDLTVGWLRSMIEDVIRLHKLPSHKLAADLRFVLPTEDVLVRHECAEQFIKTHITDGEQRRADGKIYVAHVDGKHALAELAPRAVDDYLVGIITERAQQLPNIPIPEGRQTRQFLTAQS